MSYLNRNYITPSGNDLTDVVLTIENVKKFNKICQLEDRVTKVGGLPKGAEDVVTICNMLGELYGTHNDIYYSLKRQNCKSEIESTTPPVLDQKKMES